ncbi:MAG: hypothetical protein E7434_06305 [Ruminococcaceae bacterium]|nr:hypothetical protein [Oscillospiraceae bacterium]
MKSKIELVRSAIDLTKVGEALNKAKINLKTLIENGYDYESQEVKDALNECMHLSAQWTMLEEYHLALKSKIAKK